VLHTALDTQVASDLHPRPLAQILSKARFLWPNLGDLIVGGGGEDTNLHTTEACYYKILLEFSSNLCCYKG
jgi:hypothetical protein